MRSYLHGTNYDKVIKLRKEHSDWSCAFIGREVSITRERVRQILKQAGLKTKEIFIPKQHICPSCNKVTNNSNVYCSKECHDEHKYESCICTGCGIKFKRFRREVTRRKKQANKEFKIYCTRVCFLKNGWNK